MNYWENKGPYQKTSLFWSIGHSPNVIFKAYYVGFNVESSLLVHS
jgi:hypothetical protein